MRLFVSIDPPKEICQLLAERVPDIPGIRKVKTEQIHLTLLFLGEQSGDNIHRIREALDEIRFEPFEVTVNELGVFPDSGNPSVLWAGLEESSDLIRLQKEISDVLSKFTKSENEARSYKPHITLARLKNISATECREIISEPFDSITFRVTGFKLKKSVLRKSGAEHETLKVYS